MELIHRIIYWGYSIYVKLFDNSEAAAVARKVGLINEYLEEVEDVPNSILLYTTSGYAVLFNDNKILFAIKPDNLGLNCEVIFNSLYESSLKKDGGGDEEAILIGSLYYIFNITSTTNSPLAYDHATKTVLTGEGALQFCRTIPEEQVITGNGEGYLN